MTADDLMSVISMTSRYALCQSTTEATNCCECGAQLYGLALPRPRVVRFQNGNWWNRVEWLTLPVLLTSWTSLDSHFDLSIQPQPQPQPQIAVAKLLHHTDHASLSSVHHSNDLGLELFWKNESATYCRESVSRPASTHSLGGLRNQ